MSSPTPQDFEKASQIWCQPKHSKKEFDSELAQSFAQALADERERVEKGSGIFCPCIRKIESLQSEKSLLEKQIDKLAKFIMAEVKGEPSQSEGAVDCAIRIIRELEKRIEELSGMAQSAKDNRRAYEVQKEKNQSLEKRVRELECQITLPNHWRCPKCKFYQVNSILAPEGVFADKRTPENCPNDGTEMMPVTWKENANDNYEGACKQAERATKAETENSRLRVENERLKAEVEDLKDQVASWAVLENPKTKLIESLESRLAEAVMVLNKVSKLSDISNVEEYCHDFLKSPTNSKALEIVRVNREAIKTVVNFIRGGQWREVYIGERYDQFKTSIKSEFKRQLFEALDALTSEEGKV